MCMISTDRFFTIRFPLKYGRNKTRKYMKIKIFLVWVISILICFPMFILGVINEKNVFNEEKKECSLENPNFKIYGSIFAFYIPLLIIAVAYIFTMRSLKKSMKNKKSFDESKKEKPLSDIRKNSFCRYFSINWIIYSKKINRESHLNNATTNQIIPLEVNEKPKSSLTSSKTSSKASRIHFQHNLSGFSKANNERKALKVLIIIFVIFVALWTPFFVVNTLSVFCFDACKSVFPLMGLFTWLGYISSSINPIIYTVFNKTFRKTFIALLTCKSEFFDLKHQRLIIEKSFSFRRSGNEHVSRSSFF